MNARDIAFGQIKAAIKILVQAQETLAEEQKFGGAALSYDEYARARELLLDAGVSSLRAINVLTESEAHAEKIKAATPVEARA